MKIHFISIGGSAMHNLALALHAKGYIITGSDDTIFEPSRSRLLKENLLPEEEGWFPEKINEDLDAVIVGMHARADNSELLKAQSMGIRVFSYPEFIYEQSKHKTRVVIGGSHGKTTITSMILHVMNYHEREVDYLVGAQLDGFDTMVHLTDENDFIVLEGDEYLASPIDRRPKFHLYQPNIALISGIAWDHINVFPTFEDYIDQFRIFTDSVVRGGIMVYNLEDEIVKEVVETSQNTIRKHGYITHNYRIDNGQTLIETSEGELPVEIFGRHNLNNLSGAKWICQHMGIDEADFYEAIGSFRGADKRLEKIAENPKTVIFKDFAHAPSKVGATVKAVRQQYPDKKLLACLELHTYSSLNHSFIDQYSGMLDQADEAVVFYTPEALKIKKLEAITPERITSAFSRKDLTVITDARGFKTFLLEYPLENTVVLLMSSGDYGGLDFDNLRSLL
ncbi:UDP-N-acetylmuramate--L-alanine ligase [Ascidiimonas aurantiaca]|uniref:UDP-N-acetylmuramate--L-alanine ligase n=1 Tax=Ascidiimonas aurantiaca TaxID=1685432 RepID=UPI0030EF99EC